MDQICLRPVSSINIFVWDLRLDIALELISTFEIHRELLFLIIFVFNVACL